MWYLIVSIPDLCTLTYFEDNELYFLSFGVRAKPGIAKDLIEADDIGRKAVAYSIDSVLVLKNLSFTSPIKC